MLFSNKNKLTAKDVVLVVDLISIQMTLPVVAFFLNTRKLRKWKTLKNKINLLPVQH